MGHDYVHTAIDDHSRLAYAEIHHDEKDPTCAAFLTHATAFYAALGIAGQRPIDRVNNGRSQYS